MSWKGLGGPPGGIEGVGRRSWRTRRDREEWKGSGVEDTKPYLEGRDGSGGTSGGLGGLARDGRGRESTQECTEGLGGSFREPRRARMAGSGRESHPEDQEWSECPPGGMGQVERDRRCQEALQESQ